MEPGAYFVTALTHQRRPVLGTLTRGGVVLTRARSIVYRCWADVQERFPTVTIDTFVVMPDHVHAIVVLSRTENRSIGLSQVVGWVKRRASREIRLLAVMPSAPLWHRSFHDSIIRDRYAFVRVRRYVTANPARAWAKADLHR
jgi:putative transposase